jgi:hypothetical protein
VGFSPETAPVDNSKLNSTFDTKKAGRASFSGDALRFVKQSGTDTVYNTLVREYNTHIVVRRDVTSSTAWTASQTVEVYPSECGEVKNLPPEANAMHKYEVPIFVTTPPNLRAVVA